MEQQQEDVDGAVPILRACGSRVAKGLYWEVGMSQFGTPPEQYIVDPPQLLPPGLALPALGVRTITVRGVVHLLSHIGGENYVNPSDYYEEYRRFGVSWRMPKNLPFDKLTPGKSRLLLTHSHGWIDHLDQYETWVCPRLINTHSPSAWSLEHVGGPCVGGWWEDLMPDTGDTSDPLDSSGRTVLRNMPSFSYTARRTPPWVKAPHRQEAICFSLPCTRFVVIHGDEDGENDATIKKVSRSGFRVEEVDN